MRPFRLILVGWFCWLATGCATQYVLPMTSSELVDLGVGKALVVYLGQPDASPSVCDTKSKGPHVNEFTSDFQDALVKGFVDGKIQPALWERCVKRVLRNLPEDRAAAFYDQLMREHRKLIRGSAIEEDPKAAERLVALQNLYLDRRRDQNGHPEVVGPLFEELRKTLGKADALGPVARDMGRELLATLDIEKGRWQDQDVSVAMMDELAAAGNTMTLERFAKRLPDPALSAEASRRIIRVHIALSPFSEVRDAAQPVEERVLAEGKNRISLAQHPLVRAWFDPNNMPMRSVVVRQDVWRQTVKLLGSSAARPTPSVLPELPFRGALWAELKSISRPVSVCVGRKNFDPSPCLDVSDIALDNPFTYLDRSATFHFQDGVSLASVVPLAAANDFSLPVRIAGVAATTLNWGLSFERPEDLQFSGAQAGSDGPDLEVHVERPHPSRFIFYATRPSATYLAIVESPDLGQFRVASVGARGYSGTDGSPGMNGSDGAQCQDGGDGSDGGSAGNGGPGGDGGDVHVRVFCGQYDCNDMLASVRGVVVSLGGAGGPGGRGGVGGRGGNGGSGRSPSTSTDAQGNTVQTDAGCSAGSSGRSGNNGADGYDGPNGSPGRVTFEVVP
jgi:hypothetical protein